MSRSLTVTKPERVKNREVMERILEIRLLDAFRKTQSVRGIVVKMKRRAEIYSIVIFIRPKPTRIPGIARTNILFLSFLITKKSRSQPASQNSIDLELKWVPLKQPPPDINRLIVLPKIFIYISDTQQVDSKVLIKQETDAQSLSKVETQLGTWIAANIQPETPILNNLGCARAFLYTKTSDTRLKTKARDTFKTALDKAKIDDDAKAAAGTNLIIVSRW